MTVSHFARRPVEGEYAPYFDTYLTLVDETDIFEILARQVGGLREVLSGKPPSMMEELHGQYTWTINQALGHLIDVERIFGYRTCRVAANDSTDMPGFNENDFVANLSYEGVTTEQLVDELDLLRQSNIAMLRRLQPECWDRMGQADGKPISVRALAYLLVGHVRHHRRIFEQRLAT